MKRFFKRILREVLEEVFDNWANKWFQRKLPGIMREADERIPGAGHVILAIAEELRDEIKEEIREL